MPALQHDALWSKSKAFVDRATQARDQNDDLGFHLWASLALELLAKAALAAIHPTLVADPNHFASLLAACGRGSEIRVRSITAKTVYERMKSVSAQFDERMARECMLFAERRNAELHSGETPTIGLDPRSWIPPFWKAADHFCTLQGATLDDWLGRIEADRARAIIADAAEVARQGVLARIERRSREFAQRYPTSADRAEVAARNERRPVPPRMYGIGDAYDEATCPSCGLRAWLIGYQEDEQILEEARWTGGPEDYEPEELVRITYSVQYFECFECGLTLDGTEEIELADLPESFSRDIYREPDYEAEYGNE